MINYFKIYNILLNLDKQVTVQIHRLAKKGFELLGADFERIPTVTKKLTEEQMADVEKLLERLEDDDDVLKVYNNMVDASAVAE